MEFENHSRFQKGEDNGIAFLDSPLSYEETQRQPIGTLVGDAEILQDLDRVIQNGQEDEDQSACGCSTPCSCSGSSCSCGSDATSESLSLQLLDDMSASFLELSDVFENVFSPSGSSAFEQLPMQDFLTTAEQALNRLLGSMTDTMTDTTKD